jgi:hypothetical protein
LAEGEFAQRRKIAFAKEVIQCLFNLHDIANLALAQASAKSIDRSFGRSS